MLAFVAALIVPPITVAQHAQAATSASDDFTRANGSLGPNWTDIQDGGLAISSDAAVGTSASGNSGDMWTADSFTSDQFSQITLTSTQLTGSQWIGAAVRMQAGGLNDYVGLYFWNFGNPELMLFRRQGGGWTQLGNTYSPGPLPAGTVLGLTAVGSSLSFTENGTQRISVSDSTLTGGAPGILANLAAEAASWTGGNAGAGGGTTPTTYSVGGTVSGLTGTLVLQDNGADNLTVNATGPFTFATQLATGATYNVTVATPPPGQTCSVSGGTGTVAAANITSVSVTCTTTTQATYSVGGTVSGLTGTLVLQDNGADNLTVNATGPFTFATQLATGATYNVTVATAPQGQTCSVSGGSGTVAAANITSVSVTCTTTTHGVTSVTDNFARANGSLGPNWTNIQDGGLAISSDAAVGTSASGTSGDMWTANSFTSDQFSQITLTATQLTGSQWIGTAVRMQNSGLYAYVGLYFWNFGNPELMLFRRQGGGWTQIGNTYSPGPLPAGTVLELTAVGSSLSFIENGTQRIAVSDTAFTGGAPGIIANLAATAATWAGGDSSDAGLYSGGGTLPATYSVGGTVSGLTGTLVLQDNATDNLTVNANGSFTFATQLATGTAYNVTVATAPQGQTCSVSGGSGTVAAANITSVSVTCTTTTTQATYSVGGTASGLSGPLVLQDNGADNLTVGTNGSFTFATQLATGATYNVTVATPPTGQTCSVSGGSGTVAAVNITSVSVTCTTTTQGGGTNATDNFARANGSLGPNWTNIQDGGLAISANAAVGTNASGNSGDMWTANSFTSDQFSQITLTATQLTGSQWIGAAVRMLNSGLNGYVGIYFWNSGSPLLMLFRRQSGGWTQIGNSYSPGLLPAGTVLELTAEGNSLSFSENGTQRIGVSDTAFTGGAPGIIANQAAKAASWAGGNATFQISPSTSANGVQSYDVISPDNGYGPQVVRVLQPTNPAPGVAHNFIITLPVMQALNNTYGDGLDTLQSLNAQNQYNLTVIEPTFGVPPWYADNPADPSVQYESFLTQELVPWIRQNLSTTGNEQIWLIGFSKSGVGAQDLILKHPDLFTLAASWDSPMDIASYNQFDDSAFSYGTDANFQANYRLTSAFVQAHAAPFETSNRIWLGGYSMYQADMTDYDALLTANGVLHTAGPSQPLAHSWTSGWVPAALAGLYSDSVNLPG